MGSSDPIAAAARRLNGRRVATEGATRAIGVHLSQARVLLLAAAPPSIWPDNFERGVAQMQASIVVMALLQNMAPHGTAYETALAARAYLENACSAVEAEIRKGANPHG
jgi:hypothetical protein